MAQHKVGILKPFNLEKKDSNGHISEATVYKWQGCLIQNIRKELSWVPLLTLDWLTRKTANRGVQDRPETPGRLV